jgi:Transposase
MNSVGIDRHRKRSHVAAYDPSGEQLFSRRVANDPEALLELLVQAGDCRVAVEATYGWEWLVDLLEDHGYDIHLSHPSRTRAIAAARVKTDGVDARTLAQLLAVNLLPEAYIAPRDPRPARAAAPSRRPDAAAHSGEEPRPRSAGASWSAGQPQPHLDEDRGALSRGSAAARAAKATTGQPAAADRRVRRQTAHARASSVTSWPPTVASSWVQPGRQSWHAFGVRRAGHEPRPPTSGRPTLCLSPRAPHDTLVRRQARPDGCLERFRHSPARRQQPGAQPAEGPEPSGLTGPTPSWMSGRGLTRHIRPAPGSGRAHRRPKEALMSQSTLPATGKQLAYLRALATQTGTTFAMPRSRRDASREIDRLRCHKHEHGTQTDTPNAERQPAYATAPHPSEINGQEPQPTGEQHASKSQSRRAPGHRSRRVTSTPRRSIPPRPRSRPTAMRRRAC